MVELNNLGMFMNNVASICDTNRVELYMWMTDSIDGKKINLEFRKNSYQIYKEYDVRNIMLANNSCLIINDIEKSIKTLI